MEIVTLKYFLAVAKVEHIHRAAGNLGISPGSLSKAISKLEEELGVSLFRRDGRNIRLTDQGRFLKAKGAELVGLETEIRGEILGEANTFHVVLAGSEILLSHYGVNLARTLLKNHPKVSVSFEHMEADLVARVRDGEVDLGITTFDLPTEFDRKPLASIMFRTFVSSAHPLGKRRGTVPVEEVLEHPFVVPHRNLLGKISKSESSDGWRDDKFPRHIPYSSTSLKTLESLVTAGQAVAYLPEFYGQCAGLHQLEIGGCPYSCKQKVALFTKNKRRAGWLNQLF